MSDSIEDAVWDWWITRLDLQCAYEKSMALTAQLLDARR